MNHLKHLLFVSTLCSLILFTNCGEDEEAETTTITTGLSDNKDLLIGNWEATEVDGLSPTLYACQGEGEGCEVKFVMSFESNKSFIETATYNYQGQTDIETTQGSWSFDASDLTGMSLILEYPILEDSHPNFTATPDDFKVISISNKKMLAIQTDVITEKVTTPLYEDENGDIKDSTYIVTDTSRTSYAFIKQ
ncbi:hypothetical protein N9487_03190 [Cyclobacteriaceae bacterium]|nr:hypothetical protein [Cyclobacteriaceae bacterium]